MKQFNFYKFNELIKTFDSIAAGMNNKSLNIGYETSNARLWTRLALFRRIDTFRFYKSFIYKILKSEMSTHSLCFSIKFI